MTVSTKSFSSSWLNQRPAWSAIDLPGPATELRGALARQNSRERRYVLLAVDMEYGLLDGRELRWGVKSKARPSRLRVFTSL